MKTQHGFTLVEVAIAMLIIGFLIGGALMTLSAQVSIRNGSDTRQLLEQAKEALIGFAITNGRFPCPSVAPTNNGQVTGGDGFESFDSVNPNECAAPGANDTLLIPARTLGLQPIDQNGFLVDPWGRPIRYEVTRWRHSHTPTPPSTEQAWSNVMVFPQKDVNFRLKAFVDQFGFNPSPPSPKPNPNLRICDEGCTNDHSTNAVAVLFSFGQSIFPAGDEVENRDNDSVFISYPSTPNFDDVVIWISPYTLYNRMLASGSL